MRKWIGVLSVGWYLLLPHSSDFKTVGAKAESLLGWTHLGAFESALACELARQAQADRDRSRAVCVFSDDQRLRSR